MKIYEELRLSIYELLENDIVTSSLDGCDDTGEWNEGWSTGGNV